MKAALLGCAAVAGLAGRALNLAPLPRRLFPEMDHHAPLPGSIMGMQGAGRKLRS
jgi:hypothetical protein